MLNQPKPPASAAKDRAFLEGVMPGLGPVFQAGLTALTPLLAAEMARREAESTGIAEPELPTSGGRFLDTPVDSAAVRSS